MTEDIDSSAALGRYVLGLGDQLLRDVAECASGGPAASVVTSVPVKEWQEYGCQGDKCVLSLTFRAPDQRQKTVAVFVKRQLGDQGFKEAPHYQYLNQHQLPVPQIYWSLLDERQMEVLFLEDVRPNLDGDRLLDSPDCLTAFLTLAARINALLPEGEYGTELYYFGWDAQNKRGMRTVDAIWRDAGNGHLGAELSELCVASRKDVLLSLAQRLGKSVPAMERGYAHNEFTPEQIGWRRETEEMLVFDLRTAGLGPRFVDVAPWVGCPDHLETAGRRPRGFAESYLRQYLRSGGIPVTLETLLTEARMLWQASVLGGLNWWHDHALTGIESRQDDDKGRAMCLDRLARDLTHLLATAPTP